MEYASENPTEKEKVGTFALDKSMILIRPAACAGSRPVKFELVPDSKTLPKNVFFDSITGFVTGVPGSYTEKPMEYELLALNDWGVASAGFTIHVERPPPPTKLTYETLIPDQDRVLELSRLRADENLARGLDEPLQHFHFVAESGKPVSFKREALAHLEGANTREAILEKVELAWRVTCGEIWSSGPGSILDSANYQVCGICSFCFAGGE